VQTGTKISGALHVGCIGLAVFGVDFFDSADSTPIQIAEVSIISSDEFATLKTTAPEAAPDVDTAPAINEPEPTQEAAPEIVQPEKPVEPTPEPEEQVAILAPEPEPTPAPRIDTQSAPKPDVNAKEAEETVKETAPDDTAQEAEQVEEPKQEQAPKEAATEIVTEAEKPSEYAPTTSSVPRSRPRDIKPKVAEVEKPDPVEEPKPAPEEPATEEAKDPIAEQIAKDLAEAEKAAQNNGPSVPVGPPLTGGEREGLVLAVQKCWNVPVGLQNADDLAVVIGIELNPDGKLAGNPKLLEPSGTPTGALKQAFEAGRRALIRCAPYDLPKEKYEQWRQIEVVFNPEKMVLR